MSALENGQSLCLSNLKINQMVLVRQWHSILYVLFCSRAHLNPPAITHIPMMNCLNILGINLCSSFFCKEISFCNSRIRHLREVTHQLQYHLYVSINVFLVQFKPLRQCCRYTEYLIHNLKQVKKIGSISHYILSTLNLYCSAKEYIL